MFWLMCPVLQGDHSYEGQGRSSGLQVSVTLWAFYYNLHVRPNC